MSTDTPAPRQAYGHRLQLAPAAALINEPGSVYRCLDCETVERSVTDFKGVECHPVDHQLPPGERAVENVVATLKRDVRRSELPAFIQLVALRQAYAELVRDRGLNLDAVDTRVDKERFGRGWDGEK